MEKEMLVIRFIVLIVFIISLIATLIFVIGTLADQRELEKGKLIDVIIPKQDQQLLCKHFVEIESMLKGWYKTSKGDVIRVTHMDDKHLINAYKKKKKNARRNTL